MPTIQNINFNAIGSSVGGDGSWRSNDLLGLIGNPPVWSATPLVTGTAGQAGSVNLNNSVTGTDPKTFALVSGSLPAWASLNTSTGVLSWTTSSVEGSTTNLVFSATNAAGGPVNSASVTLTINAAPVSNPPSLFSGMLLGTNHERQHWYNHTDALSNIVQIASGLDVPWVSVSGSPPVIDSNGFITSLTGVARRPLISRENGFDPIYNGDEFTVKWTGSAEVAVDFFVNGEPGSYDSTNEFTFTYNAANGGADGDALTVWVRNGSCADLVICRTADLSEYEAGNRYFTPEHVENTQYINTHVSRFMHWSDTNTNLQMTASDLTPDEYIDTDYTSFLMQIRYANQANVNPWLCLPARSDSTVWTTIANLIANNLEPHLIPHIELGNELWNTGGIFSMNTNWARLYDAPERLTAVSIPNAATGAVFTELGHGFSNNDVVRTFAYDESETASGYNYENYWQLAFGYTDYYVSVIDVDTYTLLSSPNGSEVDWTQSGFTGADELNQIYVKAAADSAHNADLDYNYGDRCIELWDVFDSILGASNYKHVIAGHIDNAYGNERRLSRVTGRADMLAIAPYPGGGYLDEPDHDTKTATEIRDYMIAETDRTDTGSGAIVGHIRANKTHADSYSVDLVCYEGGSHIAYYSGGMPANVQAYFGSSEEGEFYDHFLSVLAAEGITLFCNWIDIYNTNNFYSWGAKEALSSSNTAARQSALRSVGLSSDTTGVTGLYALGHSLINFEMPVMLAGMAEDDNQGAQDINWQMVSGSTIKNHVDNYKSTDGGNLSGPLYDDNLTDRWDVQLANGRDVFLFTENHNLGDGQGNANAGTQAIGSYGNIMYNATEYNAELLYDAAIAGNANATVWLQSCWLDYDGNSSNGRWSDVDGWADFYRKGGGASEFWRELVVRMNARGRNFYYLPMNECLVELKDEIEAGNVSGMATMLDFFDDLVHPTAQGRYYQACVLYSFIYGRNPEGLVYSNFDDYNFGTIDAPTAQQAADFQRIAWQAYLKYRREI